MPMRFFAGSLALMMLPLIATHPSESTRGRSYLGEPPPELISRMEHWINSEQPLKLQNLKGRVVWLNFNF